ncbi:hypothetical protein E2C01_092169 [Portunus trituberculatus]|uniref:Uncharacterized protein n=1 Tax=Portunus trituberculatus TaxID=210409 RepID=A0A5B7JPW2_PORTR|nr:hypothetical protein [Portunus trituberculatus]
MRGVALLRRFYSCRTVSQYAPAAPQRRNTTSRQL